MASELVRGIDEILAESVHDDADEWTLVCPRDADVPLPLKRIQRRRAGILTKQAWEQLEAPWFARGKLLVGLCNMAPLATRGSVTLIHDAHVYTTPQSGSPAFNLWYRFALPVIGASAARIVTVSNFSRDQLVRYGIAPSEKISVIHNGSDHLLRVAADPQVLDALGLKPRRYVLAVANSQVHKNIRVLFEACSALTDLDLRLVLVGPDDRAAFESKGLKPPNDVIFSGYRTDAELRALYEQAVCLAFPSTTEGFGLPPIEAMSLGCPVLASPCGALPETCGEAAIFVDPHEPAAWAAAVRRLAEDESERERVARGGAAHAAGFRWRDSARRLLDLINEVRSGAAG